VASTAKTNSIVKPTADSFRLQTSPTSSASFEALRGVGPPSKKRSLRSMDKSSEANLNSRSVHDKLGE
jgi:hypothetical protein